MTFLDARNTDRPRRQTLPLRQLSRYRRRFIIFELPPYRHYARLRQPMAFTPASARAARHAAFSFLAATSPSRHAPNAARRPAGARFATCSSGRRAPSRQVLPRSSAIFPFSPGRAARRVIAPTFRPRDISCCRRRRAFSAAMPSRFLVIGVATFWHAAS